MRYIIVLALLCPVLCMCQPFSLTGKLITETGQLIPGATITVHPATPNTGHQTPNSSSLFRTISNKAGEFNIPSLRLGDTLVITAVGYATETEIIGRSVRSPLTITLRQKVGVLDETVIIAYGTTTRRLATGSISRVTAEEIARQPVYNPLSALQGRVPGLSIAPTSGMPGAAVRIQVRGRSSLAQGSDPLFIIDGVPFAPGAGLANQYYSAAGGFPDATTGLSPLTAINPTDILSIEVLKDADATAIYGSRGAAGVILITTKKGQAGRTRFTAALTQGFSSLTRVMPMHNTATYIAMRREAFRNDGVIPTATAAPDLLAWDTARYTAMQAVFFPAAAPSLNASASLGGGNASTQFLVTAAWSREGTVVPGSQSASRGSAHLNLSHNSGRISLALATTYTSSRSGFILSDLSSYLNLPPNYPAFYREDGFLNWQEGGQPLSNPFAYLLQRYKSVNDNLLSNLNLSVRLPGGLAAKLALGYNTYTVAESTIIPKASANPYTSAAPTGSSLAGAASFKSWIIEPQLTWSRAFGRLHLSALAGGTAQQTANGTSSVSATGYTSDGLLYSFAGAAAVTATNSFTQYRYTAAFGRITAAFDGRYILNLSGRRDGSSRFGPGRQFAAFGAAGMAWLAHTHKAFRKALPFVSFAKLRVSYGTSGNDQIGAYQYLDSWSGSSRPYNGFPSLVPTRLFNPDYSWELARKANAAIDLGFLSDRFLLSVDYFENRSANQLIRYNLPAQTGFTSVLRNFPATVQNRGWEFTLNTKNTTGKWAWSTTANLTVHRNRLLSFPGIETSSYANSYIVGRSLNLVKGYRFTGVNPQTGVYTFEDTNGDGTLSTRDYTLIAVKDPACYGGLGNTLAVGPWTADIFFEFKKTTGRSWEAFTPVPGTASNLPKDFIGWWQKPGDEARYQKLTATPSTDAYRAMARYTESSAVYTDASYIRCKTLYIAYTLPLPALARLRMSAARFYFQAQNLFVLTGYRGPDPEIQNPNILQPLRTLAAGFSLTF